VAKGKEFWFKWRVALVLIGSMAFFLFYFRDLFFGQTLPADGDTWLYLALFNNYLDRISSAFGVVPFTTSMYPESAAYLYGEPSFASGMLFGFFKLITQSDVIGYNLFICLIFSLNTTSVFCLAKQYRVGDTAALFSAILFTCSSFLLGNIDNQNVITFFPGIFAWVYFLLFLSSKRRLYLVLYALCLGLQIYFSGYLFLFTSLVILIVFACRIRTCRSDLLSMLFCSVLLLAIIAPYLCWYVFSDRFSQSIDLAKHFHASDFAALHLVDFFSFLSGTLMHGFKNGQGRQYNMHALSPGFVVVLMTLIAFFKVKTPLRHELWIVILTGTLLSVGTTINVNGIETHTPLYYLDTAFHYTTWLRVPIRAYIIVSLGIAILCGLLLETLPLPTGRKQLIAASLVVINFMDTVPFHFRGCDFSKEMDIKTALVKVMGPLTPGNVLQLPSSILSQPRGLEDNDKINELQREHLYMYYQTQMVMNAINGSNGFIPASRIKSDRLIRQIRDVNKLRELLANNEIKYVIWYKSLLIRQTEGAQLAYLEQCPNLSKIEEQNDFILFEVKHVVISR
jgi:hypothetical protein